MIEFGKLFMIVFLGSDLVFIVEEPKMTSFWIYNPS